MKLINVDQVTEILGLQKITVWKWAREKNSFPKVRKLSERVTRWDTAEIEAYAANA